MLHGEIKINGVVIETWTARRTVALVDSQQVSEYECTFTWSDPFHGKTEFPIWHAYDRGAAELAKRVIEKGNALMLAAIDRRGA